MIYRDWARSRARLHHDWLHNRYLVFLASARDDLDDAGGRGVMNDDIADQLSQWWEKREQWAKWVIGAEDALSPRQYLDEPPLDTLPGYHKKWLGAVIHEFYCETCEIRSKTKAILDKLTEIDNLVTLCERQRDAGEARPERPGHLLAEKCHELSAQVSQLPHNVVLP